MKKKNSIWDIHADTELSNFASQFNDSFANEWTWIYGSATIRTGTTLVTLILSIFAIRVLSPATNRLLYSICHNVQFTDRRRSATVKCCRFEGNSDICHFCEQLPEQCDFTGTFGKISFRVIPYRFWLGDFKCYSNRRARFKSTH